MGLMNLFGRREKQPQIETALAPMGPEFDLPTLQEGLASDKGTFDEGVALLLNVDTTQVNYGRLKAIIESVIHSGGYKPEETAQLLYWANRLAVERQSEALNYERVLQLVPSEAGRLILKALRHFASERPAAVISYKKNNLPQQSPFMVKQFIMKDGSPREINANRDTIAFILDPIDQKKLYFVAGKAGEVVKAQQTGIIDENLMIAWHTIKSHELNHRSLSDLSAFFVTEFNTRYAAVGFTIDPNHIEQAIYMLLLTPQALDQMKGSDPVIDNRTLFLRSQIVELIKQDWHSAFPFVQSILGLGMKAADFENMVTSVENPFTWESISRRLTEKGKKISRENMFRLVRGMLKIRNVHDQLVMNQIKDAEQAEMHRLGAEDIASQIQVEEAQDAADAEALLLTELAAEKRTALENSLNELLPEARKRMASLTKGLVLTMIMLAETNHTAQFKGVLEALRARLTEIPDDHQFSVDNFSPEHQMLILNLMKATQPLSLGSTVEAQSTENQENDTLSREDFFTLFNLVSEGTLNLEGVDQQEVLATLQELYQAQGQYDRITFSTVSGEVMNQVVTIMRASGLFSHLNLG